MLLQVLQRLAGQVDFIVAGIGFELLLIVLGDAVDFAPVDGEVGRPLLSEALVLAQRKQRLVEPRGLPLQQAQGARQQEPLLLLAIGGAVAQTGGELGQIGKRALARAHRIELGAEFQVGQPHHVLGQFAARALRRLGSLVTCRQLPKPAPAHRRLGALDDGPDFLPHQLRVVASGARQIPEYGVELGQPGRRRLPPLAAAEADDFCQQLAEGREAHRLRSTLPVGGSDQAAVDALREPLQMGAAGEKQRPLAGCGCPGRDYRHFGGGELTYPVAQQEVDRDGGLATAGGTRQQQGRFTVQQPRLLAGQVQVQLHVVGTVGRLQAAPFFVVHHQPALRPGIGRGVGVRRCGGPVEGGRKVPLVQVVDEAFLRQLLDGVGLKVEEGGVRRHDAPRGGRHRVMFLHSPHVDAGRGAVFRQRSPQGKQNAVGIAEARLEHRTPAAVELLDAQATGPHAVLQKVQLLAQTSPRAPPERDQMRPHRVVEEELVRPPRGCLWSVTWCPG